MNANQVIEKARKEFIGLGKKPTECITSLSKTQEGWAIQMESVERKAIPDTMDVLGLYELRMDEEGCLLSVDRKKLRKRGETKDD
jgi:hypothetical protein